MAKMIVYGEEARKKPQVLKKLEGKKGWTNMWLRLMPWLNNTKPRNWNKNNKGERT